MIFRACFTAWLRLLSASTVALLLAGCISLAPEYQRPAAPVPDNFPSTEQAAQAAQLPEWQSYFSDPDLQQLIFSALDNNPDARIAALRVDEARAAFGIQRSERLPTISAAASGSRARVPADIAGTADSLVVSEYGAQVGFSSWELDLWGRIRSLEEAALNQWLATEAGERAARLTLIAQVADGYLRVRELDERLAVAQASVASRQLSYDIFSRRYAAGATARLDLLQVQTLLTQAQSLLAQLELERSHSLNALQQLVGSQIQLPPLQQSFAATMQMPLLPAGLPSQLLQRRPDIMLAEHRLRAANASIGAARANFFPRIALTGAFGTASSELDGLFESGSRAWSFSPTISLPLFDGGRRRANLELARVRQEIGVVQYEQAIQNAFREVADALAGRHWLGEQLSVQQQAYQAQSERARLARLRYDNGSAAYLEVLDAERDLLAAGQQLVQARSALLSSQIGLYLALGGGPLPPVTAEQANGSTSFIQPGSRNE